MKNLRRWLLGLVVVGAVALGGVGLTALVRVFLRHPLASAEVAGALVVAASAALMVTARLGARVPSGTILELDLPSAPSEVVDRNPLARLSGRRVLTLADTVAELARASRDKRVRGLVLRPRFASAPRAVIEELRDAVTAFGQTGKFTVALADSFGEGAPSTSAYYLATACEELVLHPTGLVGLAPLSLEHNFYRGLLDRLGIEIEVLARHEFKSVFNRLSERGYTGPDREQSQRLLDSLWERFVDDVARARNLAPEQVRLLADRAPLLAREALEGGLVDRLAYADEVVTAAKARVGPHAQLLYLAAYKRRAGRERQPGKAVAVAVLHAAGEIHRSSSLPFAPTGRPVLAADKLIPQIRAAAKDKKVEALVLRVDSPGGSAVASDAIWRELVKLREAGKPLVVSMGAVAASGGYYLAAAADRIVAQPGTITGSIGVITVHPVLAKAKAKLDVTTDEVHTGAEPSMFSLNRAFSAGQQARLEALLDDTYGVFAKRVADGRKLPIEKVLEIAKGRVWTGADGLDLGLVDELGGLQRAMALAVELTGAPAGTPARAKPLPRRGGRPGRLRSRQPDSSDDIAAAGGADGGVLFSPWSDALARAASGLDRYRVSLHLGCDPRRYWLP